jgi:hypothetical protein
MFKNHIERLKSKIREMLVNVGILACSTCDYSGIIYAVSIQSHNMLIHD